MKPSLITVTVYCLHFDIWRVVLVETAQDPVDKNKRMTKNRAESFLMMPFKKSQIV